MEEFSIKSIKKRYIFLVMISPVILIFLMCIVIKYGTILINTGELIIDISSPVKIGEYLGYYFTVIGIELTALLSYALWRTSVRSNNLAKAINDKEENRDSENIRESALTVYYDLIFKISMLKMLYTRSKHKSNLLETKKLIISSDWVKHVVNLRNVLNRHELYCLFDLYNSFQLLHDLGENVNREQDELEDLIKHLANKMFIPSILNYLWMDFSGEIEATLNSQYFMVFRKIQATINNELESKYYTKLPSGEVEVKLNSGHKKYTGEFANGKLRNGVDYWESSNGHMSYTFKYENYNIIEGNYSNKVSEVDDIIFDCRFDSEGKQTTGRTTLFYESNNIKYKGEIVNQKYDGEGSLYYDSKIPSIQFTGVWKEGKRVNGEYINKNSDEIKYFKGEYRNNTPYTGEIEVGDTYEFRGAYGFKGIIREGKLIKGHGHMFSKNYFDEEYLSKHPEHIEEVDDYEYDYEQEEIPEEIQQEMREDSIRSKNEIDKQMLLEQCGKVVELIAATWEDGDVNVYPDDSLYKKYFGLRIKKK